MHNTLKREINFFQALMTVIGTVIGAGVFFKISSITAQTGSTSATIFVWILAGVISITSGLTVSELATAMPVTGGPTKYIEYTYGKPMGFLFGWAQMLIYFPANVAALSIIFATQFTVLFNISAAYITLIAVILAIFLTLMNFFGTKFSSHMQTVISVIKVIPIILIILFGLFNTNKIDLNLWPITTGPGKNFFSGISGALLSAMFAYDGWINVTNLAGEVKHPEKNLPRAIIIGLGVITLIYVLVNYTFMSVSPLHTLVNNPSAAFDSSIRLFGPIGGKIITIGIMLSVYGAVNGYIMTGMRVPYTLARDNLIPFSKSIAKLNVNTGVPIFSALVILLLSIIMMFLGTFDLLTDMLVFVMWGFTTLISIAVFVLRKREPDLERPYKVLLYPIIPIISIIGGLFIVGSTLINQFWLSLVGIGITLVGLPVYYLYQKRHPNAEKNL